VGEAATSATRAWESFYVIVGSSAAALTGLQFVVIVLSAEVNLQHGASATRAFGTPTVLHFCAVLLISAVLSAPWASLSSVAWVLEPVKVARTKPERRRRRPAVELEPVEVFERAA